MGRRCSLGVVVLFILASSCAAQPARQTTSDGMTKPVAFTILEDYDKGQNLNAVQADFDLFNELGIHTWRGSFGWDDYEPTPGHYDFSWLIKFVQLAAREQITLRPYLGYTPEWAAKPGGNDHLAWNNPPADLQQWHDFVFRIASTLKAYPNVRSFEIYNEENSPLWWDGTAEEYSRVVDYGSAAIRAAHGHYQILLGGLTYPDTTWMERVCGALSPGETFDVLPIHAYPETWTAKGVDVENYLDHAGYFEHTFLPTVDEACGRKPIWINELGFATTPGKRSERDQANWWARAVATFLAEPRVQELGIYEIREPAHSVGVIGEPENYYLGLIHHDGRKKLAFYTVKRLVSLLDTRTITVADSEVSVDVVEGKRGALYHHLFIRPDGQQILFVWDKTRSPVVQIRLTRPGTQATAYALDGTGSPFRNYDGQTLTQVQLTRGEVRIFRILPIAGED